MLDGATEDLSGKSLYDFVLGRCRKATRKNIVWASLLALTDPHVTDRNVLHTIYTHIEWTKSGRSLKSQNPISRVLLANRGLIYV